MLPGRRHDSLAAHRCPCTIIHRALASSHRAVPWAIDIFKTLSFEAAHRLPNMPAGHKCARLRGHSFGVEIHVTGEVRAKSGWILDAGEVKAAYQPLHEVLDHHHLNDVEGLDIATSEQLAISLFHRLCPARPMLSRAVVRETCTAGCRYRGFDAG